MRRFLLAGLLSLGMISGAGLAVADLAVADDEQPQVAIVTAPFLELHTGPGDVYPVTRVIERGDELEVLKGRTGWYKVRGPRGYTGWVSVDQLEAAIEAQSQ